MSHKVPDSAENTPPRALTLLTRSLAVVGGLALVAALTLLLARRAILESALRSALAGTAVTLKSVDVGSVGLKSIDAKSIDAGWEGQRLRIGSLDIRVGSLIPPRVESATISGVELTLEPTRLAQLFKAAPTEVAADDAPMAGTVPTELIPREFSGDVKIRFGAEPGPVLTMRSLLNFDGQRVSGTVSGTGGNTKFSVVAEAVPRESSFGFRLTDGNFDLAEWWPTLRAFAPDSIQGLTAEGRVRLDLRGSFAGSELSAGGTTAFENIGFALPERGLKLSGIDASIEWEDLASLRSVRRQSLTVRSAAFGDIVAETITAKFSLENANQIRVDSLSLKLFDGAVTTAPGPITLSPLGFEAEVSLRGVDLAQITAILPKLDADLTGRIDGNIRLAVNGGQVRIRGGNLNLRKDVDATVRLRKPGLLTAGMKASGPSYEIMKKVEDGLLNLKLDSLDIALLDAAGPDERSATVQLAGHPISKDVKAPVSVEMNVNGPIAALISTSLRKDLSASSKP